MRHNYKYTPYLLILITIIVFFPTFTNDFQIKWDDTWQVLENPFVLDHSFENLRYHFTSFYNGQYSPINTLVYIAIYKLFGFNATAFHTTFLIVHVFNILLVFYILKDILKTAKPEFGSKRIHVYATFTSLIFAIHPLQVESVAWLSASKIILYAFFLLLALWCYVRYIHNNKVIWLFAIAILYALSFGSKEQAIILPLNLLVLDYIYGKYKHLKFNKSLLTKRILLDKIPFFGLAMFFWYFSTLFNLGNVVEDNGYPMYQRLLFGMHSLVEYIFRSIAPVKLYFYYSFPIIKGEALPWFYWGYIVLTLIIATFVWSQYKKRNRLVLFGVLFFIVNLVLVLHILPMPRPTITADRYMYISIIGLALIAIWFIDITYTKFYVYKKQIITVLLFYIAFLGTHTFYRTQAWKNSVTMKKNINDLLEKRGVLKQTDTLLIKQNKHD